MKQPDTEHRVPPGRAVRRDVTPSPPRTEFPSRCAHERLTHAHISKDFTGKKKPTQLRISLVVPLKSTQSVIFLGSVEGAVPLAKHGPKLKKVLSHRGCLALGKPSCPFCARKSGGDLPSTSRAPSLSLPAGHGAVSEAAPGQLRPSNPSLLL